MVRREILRLFNSCLLCSRLVLLFFLRIKLPFRHRRKGSFDDQRSGLSIPDSNPTASDGIRNFLSSHASTSKGLVRFGWLLSEDLREGACMPGQCRIDGWQRRLKVVRFFCTILSLFCLIIDDICRRFAVCAEKNSVYSKWFSGRRSVSCLRKRMISADASLHVGLSWLKAVQLTIMSISGRVSVLTDIINSGWY